MEIQDDIPLKYKELLKSIPRTTLASMVYMTPGHLSKVVKHGPRTPLFVDNFNRIYEGSKQPPPIDPDPNTLNPNDNMNLSIIENGQPEQNDQIDTLLSLPGLELAPFQYQNARFFYTSKGDSMYPKVPNGARLGVRFVPDTSLFVSGELYVVYLKNGQSTLRYVNLVENDPDGLLLTAYNDKAKPTPIKKTDIKYLFEMVYFLGML